MAIALSVNSDTVPGDRRMHVVDVTLDGSYAAGGYAITAANVGLSSIDQVILPGVKTALSATTALAPEWDYTNGKLKFFKGNGVGALTEAANTDITSAMVIRCIFIGKG